MLDKHLIVKTEPPANSANIIFWKDYRVTLLNERLIRLEKSKEKVFRDEVTQRIWFRSFPAVKFELKRCESSALLSTEKITLLLNENREDCRIDIGSGFIPIGNDKNLKGTFRTLDGCSGNIMVSKLKYSEYCPGDEICLDDGVCSLSGVAVLDDSLSLILNENGEINEKKANGSDEYIFAYGNDYRAAVKGLFSLCGKVPLLPRFAFGNWWSRYYAYTQDEYISLMAAFKRENVPITVAMIDMDWHYSDYYEITEKFQLKELNREGEEYTTTDRRKEMLGWTGYTWNERLFPDYKELLCELKKRGMKVALNLHPAQGVRFWENRYKEMAEKLGKDYESGKTIAFDFTDDEFINAYFSVLHKPYEQDGVDFWWIDWQQGITSKMAGLDPLWALNHYHFYDHAKNHPLPVILSRYAGIGSHRYPVGFSGDAYMTWDTLNFLPYFTSCASNVGYGWWSHDIGGHGHGEKSDELYLRSVQFGVFSPINRLHCTNQPTISKEPWYYGAFGLIAEKFFRLRHSLIPFLYTANRAAHDEGRMLCEPLYYEFKNEQAYAFKNEYLFGGLLVIPITEKMAEDGYARVNAWLPEGEWTDIFTGDFYHIKKNGEERTLLRNAESIPVLAKAGSVIPYSEDGGNSHANPACLRLRVFEGTGEYVLSEDADNGQKTARTVVAVEREEKGSERIVTVTVSSNGAKGTIPKNRTVTVELFGKSGCKIQLLKNAAEVSVEKTFEKYSSVKFTYDFAATYTVKFTFTPETELDYLKNCAKKVFLAAQGDNDNKYNAYKALTEADGVQSFYVTLNRLSVPDSIRQRLTEIRPA